MDKYAFLFSGQGSQYAGMGKDLYDNYKVVREVFNEASDTLNKDMMKLCFFDENKELLKTENTQVAILTLSVAQYRLFMSKIGIKASYYAGNSLGEYAALVCGNVLSFRDALQLVKTRGELMGYADKDNKGEMVSIKGIEENYIEKKCLEFSSMNKIIGISNYNGKNNVVISGEFEVVEALRDNFRKMGAKDIKLKVSSAFHSEMMREAGEKLKVELNKYKLNNPKVNILSNVSALPYKNSEDIVSLLGEQIRKPVKWKQIMDYLVLSNVGVCVEFGPKATLRNLCRNYMKKVKAYSFDRDIEIINKEFKNLKKYSIVSRSLGIAVSTPNYNNDSNAYEVGVIEPYRRIEKIRDDIEREGREETLEEQREAVKMLQSVFEVKGISKKEESERFEQLIRETDVSKELISK